MGREFNISSHHSWNSQRKHFWEGKCLSYPWRVGLKWWTHLEATFRVTLNSLILLIRSVSAGGKCKTRRQREIMAGEYPWWWAEVENLLHGVGCKWDGRKGRKSWWRDPSMMFRNWGNDEGVFLGSPSYLILTVNQNLFIHICKIKTSTPTEFNGL